MGLIDASTAPLPHAPRNVQVFVSWPNAEPDWFELARDDGTPVAFTVEAASPVNGQFWLRPSAPLEPGTYTAREGDNSVTFIVDDATDDLPPAHTNVQGQGARLSGRCPDHVAAEVRAVREIEEDGDDHLLGFAETEHYGALYQVTVRRLGHPEPMEKTLFVRGDFPYLGEVVSDDYRWQACFENYQGVVTAYDYEASLVVYDQAGNVAEAPEERDRKTVFRFASNAPEGCGCRVGGRPRAAVAALLVLALAFTVRRVRRT